MGVIMLKKLFNAIVKGFASNALPHGPKANLKRMADRLDLIEWGIKWLSVNNATL